MAVDERRRIALHRHASASWGEEAADTLLELGAPAGQELATRADLQHLSERISARFDASEDRIDARFDASEERMNNRFSLLEQQITTIDERADERAASLENRLTATFERRISDAITAQTRALVFSQLGALMVIAALAFGLR